MNNVYYELYVTNPPQSRTSLTFTCKEVADLYKAWYNNGQTSCHYEIRECTGSAPAIHTKSLALLKSDFNDCTDFSNFINNYQELQGINSTPEIPQIPLFLIRY